MKTVFGRMAAVLTSLALLVACAGPDKPEPTALKPLSGAWAVRTAWTQYLGPVDFPLSIWSQGDRVALASNSEVGLLDVSKGQWIWRVQTEQTINAGVGGDGERFAVVMGGDQLQVFADGQALWRVQLPAQSHTPPLVAGGRVFVLAGNRTVLAFDGRTGAPLWTQRRTADPLLLRQMGALLPVGNTLVAGIAGRMLGLNPDTGAVQWDVLVGNSRATNDVERLVDVVGPASRQGSSVCARAFQASVACLDAVKGSLQWSKPANGATGLDGDGQHVVGTEADSRVVLWSRSDGQKAWVNDDLTFRSVTAPLLLGRSVIVGDGQGWLHLINRSDGQVIGRVQVDTTPVVTRPVVNGKTLIVMTQSGAISALQPD